MPARVAALERDARGYPIPWFVDRPADGSIDFRVMHPQRLFLAVQKRLCWVCGQPMGRNTAFVGGPLSVAQRLFTDPPAHRDCTEFALKVCPFLAIPSAQRREANKPPHIHLPGDQVAANPGVFGMIIVTDYQMLRPGILRAGRPLEVNWYYQGRAATRIEVQQAIEVAQGRGELAASPLRDTILDALDQLPLPI